MGWCLFGGKTRYFGWHSVVTYALPSSELSVAGVLRDKIVSGGVGRGGVLLWDLEQVVFACFPNLPGCENRKKGEAILQQYRQYTFCRPSW